MFKSIFNQTRNLHPQQNHNPPTNQLPTPDNTCCLRCVLCAYGRKTRICALVAQVYCEGCRNNTDHYQKSLLTVAFLSIRTVQWGKCELQRNWIYALFMKDNILLWKQYLMFLYISHIVPYITLYIPVWGLLLGSCADKHVHMNSHPEPCRAVRLGPSQEAHRKYTMS